MKDKAFIHDAIVLPGIGNSNEDHWQSYWEKEHQSLKRFEPKSWTEPYLDDWLVALDKSIAEAESPPILIAHSLACLLVAHWQQYSDLSIRAAFLVAVPDPESKVFPETAESFSNFSRDTFRFPTLIVASENDPYASFSYTEHVAQSWNAQVISVGELGHINSSQQLGKWPQGKNLYRAFVAGAL